MDDSIRFGGLIIFPSQQEFAYFLFSNCPSENKQIFVSENMIQLDGLDKDGKVDRRLFAFPGGKIIDIRPSI